LDLLPAEGFLVFIEYYFFSEFICISLTAFTKHYLYLNPFFKLSWEKLYIAVSLDRKLFID